MSIDTKKLGHLVKSKRKAMNFTQKETAEYTGISEETLRLMENGSREPRLITLHRLSELYKYDFIAALSHCREDIDLFSATLLVEVNKEIETLDHTDFQALITKLVNNIKTTYINDNKKNKATVNYVTYLDSIQKTNTEEIKDFKDSTIYFEKLLTTLSYDKENQLSDTYHNYLEIQVSLVLSTIYRKNNNLERAEELLLQIITPLEKDEFKTNRQIDYLSIAYNSLSYIYFRVQKFEEAITTIDNYLLQKDLRIRRDHINLLNIRKAISMYNLGDENYKHIIAHVMLSENATRAAYFNEMLLDIYNIDIRTFMDTSKIAGFSEPDSIFNQKPEPLNYPPLI